MSEGPAKQVSVTWKWLAVTCVGLMAGMASFDRAGVASTLTKHDDSIRSLSDRISGISEKLAALPTKDDVRDLRQAIDKLSDRIDSGKH